MKNKLLMTIVCMLFCLSVAGCSHSIKTASNPELKADLTWETDLTWDDIGDNWNGKLAK